MSCRIVISGWSQKHVRRIVGWALDRDDDVLVCDRNRALLEKQGQKEAILIFIVCGPETKKSNRKKFDFIIPTDGDHRRAAGELKDLVTVIRAAQAAKQ